MKVVYTNSLSILLVRVAFLSSLSLGVATCVAAPTIWNGPAITFTQAPGSGAVDQLTPNVGLTRASTQGLYNAVTESGYTHDFSPADTEWSYGELADYATLSYTNWETWNGGNPPSMVGQDAVLHLISDDIYLSIQFTSWPTGHGSPQGGFAYVRSTPAVVAPPPSFQAIAISNNTVNLTWSATPGQTYQFQYSTNLNSTNWINFGNSVMANNTTMTATDTNLVGNSTQRFFRIATP